ECHELPIRDTVIEFLNQNLSSEETAQVFLHLKENYPHRIFQNLFNNIGSHDTIRIATELGSDLRKIKLAFVLLLTFPGVPCIYYGDETALEGGKDPDNRRMYPWNKENAELVQFVKELNRE